MLRKLLTTGGVGALVAMAIGGVSFAAASNEGGARTITVIEKTTSQQFVDVGASGFSVGDEFVFASQFWNTDQTRQVGSNQGYCVALSAQIAHCAGTASLRGGTIEYGGTTNQTAQTFTIAITGGTGSFVHAEGQVTIHNLNSNGTLSRDVIQLVG